jgi:predicted Rossmann-fold nucleotide-binding protein
MVPMKILTLLALLPTITHAATFQMSQDQKAQLAGMIDTNCSNPGRALSDGELPSPLDIARDSFCAEDLQRRAAPHGFVAVYGSARDGLPIDYQLTKDFAAAWTRSSLGPRFPIATAGGGGMMAAANQGALEAGGRSLGFPTKFGPNAVEHPSPFISKGPDGRVDSYLFSSFGQRETEMIDRSVASVFAFGGIGTEWEILETMTKLQTGKKSSGPMVLLGSQQQWAPLLSLLKQMAQVGTIKPADLNLVQVAETADKAVDLIKPAMLAQMAAAHVGDVEVTSGPEVTAAGTAR